MAQLIIFMNFEAAKIRDTYGISRHHTWIFSIVPEYVNGINLSANSWELASLTSLCCLTSYIYIQKFQTVILSGDIISISEPNQDRYWVEDPRMLADIGRIEEIQDQGDKRSE